MVSISQLAAGFLGLFFGVLSVCYLGLLGIAAWKIVTNRFPGPKTCPHCGASVSHDQRP